mgnify:CR=1 FL=1
MVTWLAFFEMSATLKTYNERLAHLLPTHLHVFEIRCPLDRFHYMR